MRIPSPAWFSLGLPSLTVAEHHRGLHHVAHVVSGEVERQPTSFDLAVVQYVCTKPHAKSPRGETDASAPWTMSHCTALSR